MRVAMKIKYKYKLKTLQSNEILYTFVLKLTLLA